MAVDYEQELNVFLPLAFATFASLKRQGNNVRISWQINYVIEG